MDNDSFIQAQARADSVASEFGTSAPRALAGESLTQYRVRLANQFKVHSAFKNANLAVIANDPAALDLAEAQIYKDALFVARNPSNAPGAPLIARTFIDNAGRRITEFSGDPIEAWKPFMGAGVRYLTAINRHPGA
jgi:hypothetical protein